MKTALLAGASGLVGNELLHQLLEHPAYSRVITVSRKPIDLEHPKLLSLIVNFEKPEDITVTGMVNDVFCALGTTIKKAGSQPAFRKVDHYYVAGLAKWSESNRVSQFLVVSAMGADPASRIFYNRVKGEMEQSVAALNIPGKFVFRPSLLLGNRKEFRLGERVSQVMMQILGFLFVGGLKKYKAISASTVVRAMIRAANTEGIAPATFNSAQIQALGA